MWIGNALHAWGWLIWERMWTIPAVQLVTCPKRNDFAALLGYAVLYLSLVEGGNAHYTLLIRVLTSTHVIMTHTDQAVRGWLKYLNAQLCSTSRRCQDRHSTTDPGSCSEFIVEDGQSWSHTMIHSNMVMHSTCAGESPLLEAPRSSSSLFGRLKWKQWRSSRFSLTDQRSELMLNPLKTHYFVWCLEVLN